MNKEFCVSVSYGPCGVIGYGDTLKDALVDGCRKATDLSSGYDNLRKEIAVMIAKLEGK